MEADTCDTNNMSLHIYKISALAYHLFHFLQAVLSVARFAGYMEMLTAGKDHWQQ